MKVFLILIIFIFISSSSLRAENLKRAMLLEVGQSEYITNISNEENRDSLFGGVYYRFDKTLNNTFSGGIDFGFAQIRHREYQSHRFKRDAFLIKIDSLYFIQNNSRFRLGPELEIMMGEGIKNQFKHTYAFESRYMFGVKVHTDIFYYKLPLFMQLKASKSLSNSQRRFNRYTLSLGVYLN